MKLVYVVHGYENSGGTERVLAVKANYLVEKGYDVTIIALKNVVDRPFFEFSSKIKFYHLGWPKDDEKYKKLFIDKVTVILNEIKPDITITNGFGVTKYLYEVNDGSKKIFEFHFSKYRRKFELASLDKYSIGRFFTDIYSYKRNAIARKYDSFVVLTEEDKESWRNISKICVIPNPNSFEPLRKSSLESKRVIAVGRFTYQKGFDFLIDIWAEIYKKYPQWKLVFFGKGHKRKMLEERAEKLGLAKVIEFNDATNNIEEEYRKSSIFALTSRYEGMPLVLLEAMACGLPSVAYSCKCGPRDIISNAKDGFLIEMGDKDSYVDKLSLLIEDEELRRRMGDAAAQSVLRFQLDNVMLKWTTLFNRLLYK